MFDDIRSCLGLTDSLPSRSSISTSLIASTLVVPDTISAMSGMVITCNLYFSIELRTSFRRLREVLGRASKILLTDFCSATSAICVGEYTHTPCISDKCFLGSSSINATGEYSGPLASAIAN